MATEPTTTTDTEPIENERADGERTASKVAMGLGGALILLGIVASPELIALGLCVWLLYALLTVLARPRSERAKRDGASSASR